MLQETGVLGLILSLWMPCLVASVRNPLSDALSDASVRCTKLGDRGIFHSISVPFRDQQSNCRDILLVLCRASLCDVSP